MVRKVAVVVEVLFLTQVAYGQTNLLVNGSFEDSTVMSEAEPGSGHLAPGWLITASNIDIFSNAPCAGDGDIALDMNGTQPGAFLQSFSTTAGQWYAVSFALSGNPDTQFPPTVRTLRVQVTGAAPSEAVLASHDYEFDTADGVGWCDRWERHAFYFQADGDSATLVFESTTGEAGGPFDSAGAAVDDVAVYELLVNGSFEESTVMSEAEPGSGHLAPGWEITASNIDIFSNAPCAADGAMAIDMNGTQPGAFLQLLSTIPGQWYAASFALSGNPDTQFPPTVRTLRVQVTGAAPSEAVLASHDYEFDTSGGVGWCDRWERHAFYFQADGDSATLVFESTTGEAGGPFDSAGAAVDDVVVSPHSLAVPTVSEWGLVAMVLALLVVGTLVFIRRSAPHAAPWCKAVRGHER